MSSRHERSNTTVTFGDRLFLKVFRRLDYGVNPHLEMSRFLTERGFQHIPRLGGAIEYHCAGQSASVLMVTSVIPNSRTAWHATFDALGRFFDRVRTLPAHVAAPQCAGALRLLTCTPMSPEITEVLGTYVELARLLGQRTAELHVALASDPEHKEFAPEPFTPFYQRSLYQSMRNRTLDVLEPLRNQPEGLPPEARDLALKVVALQDTIVAAFGVVHQTPIDTQRIRIHGDYHLAQVLYTGKDFVIIDLEGEWTRPVTERRIKRSPLRDVAGMIRSFHYIAHRALRHQQEIGSFDAAQAEGAQPWVRFWSRWVSSVFLRGYLEAVAPAHLLPRDEAHLDVLLNALLLDRVLGELTRELHSRPESVHIPLRGIIDLVGPAAT